MGKKRTFKVARPAQPKVANVTVEMPTVFRLCEPTVFIVSKYNPKLPQPTEADKQRIRWFVRYAPRNDFDIDGTKDLLEEHQSLIKQNGERLEIECVPIDWHDRIIEIGAQFDSPPQEKMFSGKPASMEIYDWIAIIRKAEATYPHLDGIQMTNAMRRLASYDNEGFRMTYGGSPRGEPLKPFDDTLQFPETMSKLIVNSKANNLLTQEDIDKLIKWTRHNMRDGTEIGIIKDSDGNDLAAGHVLTGISAGVYRNKNINVRPKEVRGFGYTIDNLYATTISGDLGQVAFFVSIAKQNLPYIGNHGDATEAELIGDIDGWLIGNTEPLGGSGRTLSEILLDFYCKCKNTSDTHFRKRFTRFEQEAMNDLEDQVDRFAVNYGYLYYYSKAKGHLEELRELLFPEQVVIELMKKNEEKSEENLGLFLEGLKSSIDFSMTEKFVYALKAFEEFELWLKGKVTEEMDKKL